MQRILLTGMSGTGKSTVVCELAARGYKAVDLDTDDWSRWIDYVATPDEVGSPVEPDRDWVWQEDRVQELMSTEDADVLFVSGCAINMRQFYPQFDHIVLLSAPAETIVERLTTRANNPYGKHPDEIARVLDLMKTVEPRIRKIADHEIDTSVNVEAVVAAVLRIAEM